MGITHLCFGFSYLAAFVLELSQIFWPRRGTRVAALAFAVAGLFAHTVFLAYHQPTPAAPYGSLVLLAWTLAVFYVYVALHKAGRAWVLFLLPLLLGMVWLSYFAFRDDTRGTWFSGSHFWGMVHGILLLGASAGIALGFVASVLYLIQSDRLRRKKSPLGGMKRLSLESLERVNRRSINIAFPLLTVGLLLGLFRIGSSETTESPWTAFKVIGTFGLWIVALLLFFLRYRQTLPGRKLAMLTLAAFALLIVTLLASHPFVPGGER